MEEITKWLLLEQDPAYGAFQRKLLPNLEPERILGVRTPVLRKMARKMEKEGLDQAFLQELPHRYFEENQLHGFLISGRKDFDTCIKELGIFLPYMDNWATCDQTSPKIFKKEKRKLLPYIEWWLNASHTYTIRFGVNMLMQHYLDEDFRPEYVEWVAAIHSQEYYVNMGIAWYLATALAKQWDTVIPYLENRCLDPWVHQRTIQKARESYRITSEQKEYLRGLK
jgi:3-methyladenine DNA glycosylase AlkD